MNKLTVGSLFAGIGGFDLGFERAGFEIRWQVEIDPFATAVLAEHWPQVERFDDVRAVGRPPRRCVLESVDVLCGGFPCQDISVAGRGVGIDGAQSGLWSEFDRLIGEFRPRYVVVENVSALLARGLGRVLGDLAARGFDAEWDCLPACAFGAPHRRDRLWLVAYPGGEGRRQVFRGAHGDEGADARRTAKDLHVAGGDGAIRDVADAISERTQVSASRVFSAEQVLKRSSAWSVEPDVGRVAHGIPARVDRLRGLGNSVVPQITEWIARRIQEAERHG